MIKEKKFSIGDIVDVLYLQSNLPRYKIRGTIVREKPNEFMWVVKLHHNYSILACRDIDMRKISNGLRRATIRTNDK